MNAEIYLFIDKLIEDKYTVRKTWYRATFLTFLAEQGGLIVSVLSIAKILMKGYSEFAIQTDLVKHLYFHSDSGDLPPPNSKFSKGNREENPEGAGWRERIEEEVLSHASFNESFIFYAFYNALNNCCRGVKRYLLMSSYCKRRMNKANKFY